MKYQGYTLYPKIKLVAQNTSAQIEKAYVVDPADKKQLESAHNWAMTYRSKYDENQKYIGRDDIPGVEYDFDNDGFKLILYQAAGGSSQGGKLSFWRCIVEKDDKSFEIGISAEMLLDLMKQSTFKFGVCDQALSFVRKNGQVGMLSTSMDNYKAALEDMEAKKAVKKGRTKVHKLGHAYTTLRECSIYVADLYIWYEPVYETRPYGYNSTIQTLIGFKRLTEPKQIKWFYTPYKYNEGAILNLSAIKLQRWDLKNSLPARIDSGIAMNYDADIESAIKGYNEDFLRQMEIACCKSYYVDDMHIGLSADKEQYELPNNIRDVLIKEGYKIFE